MELHATSNLSGSLLSNTSPSLVSAMCRRARGVVQWAEARGVRPRFT
jgi:hypothetical protein